jgi:hypothetical protein
MEKGQPFTTEDGQQHQLADGMMVRVTWISFIGNVAQPPSSDRKQDGETFFDRGDWHLHTIGMNYAMTSATIRSIDILDATC